MVTAGSQCRCPLWFGDAGKAEQRPHSWPKRPPTPCPKFSDTATGVTDILPRRGTKSGGSAKAQMEWDPILCSEWGKSHLKGRVKKSSQY